MALETRIEVEKESEGMNKMKQALCARGKRRAEWRDECGPGWLKKKRENETRGTTLTYAHPTQL